MRLLVEIGTRCSCISHDASHLPNKVCEWHPVLPSAHTLYYVINWKLKEERHEYAKPMSKTHTERTREE
ncbi:hypothetical protein C0J52_11965 [Blattella germanica]|nr:hypothetical protein C0J52_11965 [Blattella germanica]